MSFVSSFGSIKRNCLLLGLASLVGMGLINTALAKTPGQVRAQCQREGRPCVGLVLSGGGARGFAHVGVIKVLEEMHIKVDVVTGTSMGAMVGGAYAAGYTGAQLEETVNGVDWKRMFASRADRSDLPWRQKMDDYSNLSSGSIRLTQKGEIVLPDSLVPSQELTLFLEKETGVVNHINDLSNLAIPFTAVATDLVNGDRVELQKGLNLAAAMRASMSVPGVFAPVMQGNRLLVDGGLVDNLPVELARKMGADVIIAVNVGTPLLKRDELNSVVAVMGQMVNLLTEKSVNRSIEALRQNDILITPSLEAFDSADMERGAEIIEAGRVAAEGVKELLAKLSSKEHDWQSWEAKRETAALPDSRVTEHRVSEVRVEGLTYINPETVLSELAFDTSRPITNEQIDEAARRIWADGSFSNVRYRFEPGTSGADILVFEPKEKEPGFASIRIGGSLETDFQSSQSFNIVFGHTWGWLNDWGGEWKNELQAGSVKRFTSEFFQPLGATSPWFVQPHLEYIWQPYDVYRGNQAVARFRNEELIAGADLGYSLWRDGYVKGTIGWMGARVKREIGEMEVDRERMHAPFVSLELYRDTLDNINFPTKGSFMQAKLQRFFGADEGLANQTVFHFSGRWPVTYGQWTLLTQVDLGKAALDNLFSLGGALQMTGTPYNRWAGSNLQWGSLTLSRNMSDVLNVRGNPLWIGASVELGRAWNEKKSRLSDSDSSFHQGIGAYIGVDSMIGPLYLVTGYTRGVGSGVYFFWGHPMD